MTTEYDRIGKTYTSTRAADPRISQNLIELLKLPPNSSIIDIGAGSGNYSLALAEHGFRVTAVELSEIMRKQEKYRDGKSSFSKLDAVSIERGLSQLRDDLENGTWLQKYGALLEKEFYDRGYVFLKIGNAL